MKICFLDCDGVLNCGYSPRSFGRFVGCDDDKLERLKKIIDATGAKIVLSSTWRLDKSKDLIHANGIYDYLIDNLQRYGLEIYDVTENLSRYNDRRGTEINTWLDKHDDVTDWVVLDDQWFYDFSYEEYDIPRHLVETQFYAENGGLQEEHVEQAIRILNGSLNEVD